MSLSLYNIEASLLELVRLREDAEYEGDSEALKVIDDQIREYLTAEAAKVTSYVALIHSKRNIVEACDHEMDRIEAMRRTAQSDIDRLKALALEVMQRFDVKELKATPGGGLRRQGNGGLQALETVDVTSLPEHLQTIEVVMPLSAWRGIDKMLAERGVIEVQTKPPQPMTERIREALKQRIVCPECKGALFPADLADVCARCAGEGTIANTIPGVKLLPRGEHVRVI